MRTRIAKHEPCAGFFENVQRLDGWVAGGFARYVLGINEDIEASDVDVFCLGEEHYQMIVETFVNKPVGYLKEIVHSFGERQHSYLTEKDLITEAFYKFLEPNKGVYKAGTSGLTYGKPKELLTVLKFQFIKKWDLVHPKQVIADFDFTVCCCYLDFINKRVFFTKEFLEDEFGMNLRLAKVKMNLPIHLHMFRLEKYTSKGYKMFLEELMRYDERLKSHKDYEQYLQSVFSNVENFEATKNTLVHNFHDPSEVDTLEGIIKVMALPENM